MSDRDHCDCALEGESNPDAARCHASGPDGVICSRPDGHDGPHAACNPVEHPVATWEGSA